MTQIAKYSAKFVGLCMLQARALWKTAMLLREKGKPLHYRVSFAARTFVVKDKNAISLVFGKTIVQVSCSLYPNETPSNSASHSELCYLSMLLCVSCSSANEFSAILCLLLA